ncbi:MAG: MarR family winged helix-turn-helix transcriptional regulator [Gammaproteobacteria bacterium]
MRKKSKTPTETKSFRSFASFRLHKLARLSDRMHERQYQRDFGLNLREYRIIGLTGSLGGASFRRICAESGLDKAHVSRLIARLIKRGFLSKRADPTDQRTVNVTLTERGKAVRDGLHAASAKLNEQWLAALPATQRTAFLSALDTLHERAQAIADDREQAAAASGSKRIVRKKAPAGARPAPKGKVVLNKAMATQLLGVLNAALGKRG